MDEVRFSASEAEQLIIGMRNCCIRVGKETVELQDIVRNSSEWDDNQRIAFDNNIGALVNDLKNAVSIEAEYMEEFRRKILELRG